MPNAQESALASAQDSASNSAFDTSRQVTGQDAVVTDLTEVDTAPITLVHAGDALGSIFGTLDPSTIASCGPDGVCGP